MAAYLAGGRGGGALLVLLLVGVLGTCRDQPFRASSRQNPKTPRCPDPYTLQGIGVYCVVIHMCVALVLTRVGTAERSEGSQ